MLTISDSLTSAIGTFVTSAATGTVTALLAVNLALGRFRKERWWDRKERAYSDLLGALYHVRSYAASTIDRYEGGAGTPIDDELMEELAARSAAAHDEIRRAIAMGNFVISKEAAALLEKLGRSLDDPHHDEDIYEMASSDLKVVEVAIRDLKVIAKHDLKIS